MASAGKKFLGTVRGRTVLILGLGRYPQGSGQGAAQYFLRQGARVIVTDLKSSHELRQPVRLLRQFHRSLAGRRGQLEFVLGRHQLTDVAQSVLVVRNPGVPTTAPLVAEARRLGIPVETDISLFFRLVTNPIIGVTGTRGKTTTSTLIAEILKQKYSSVILAGNSQASPLFFLSQITPHTKIVLELSSWMLQSLDQPAISPTIGVFTNFYPDHLNVHTSLAEYLKAKTALFRHQKKSDWLVVNYDNPTVRRAAGSAPSRVFWFSRRPLKQSAAVFCRQGKIIARFQRQTEVVIDTALLPLKGEHNLENILAAVAVGRLAGVSLAGIKKSLTSFAGVPGRQELVAVVTGVEYYNDTTATTPEALQAALRTLGQDKKLILIAGGQNKNLNYARLKTFFSRFCKAIILLPGTASDVFPLEQFSGSVKIATSMKQAVQLAHHLAQAGDRVVLSPAAASFNLFINEFDRGDQFTAAVKSLTVRSRKTKS